MSQDQQAAPAVDPSQLELRAAQDEFRVVVDARIGAAEAEGDAALAARLRQARDLGCAWLPDAPGGPA